ncbi:MAG: hypothetical protein IPP10_15860 [Candidatus Competibacteraceae bacterium]|jgi:hypothetical protein|nr:hypothetical protein [Candidatus Competibacteraceae bacterium]MBK8897009.1 hypothetical protein [Candidatus Competibacteraceae bacterium]MBK9952924.1 hypothetical protein [Candidatus Competibacteraceae bacterium]
MSAAHELAILEPDPMALVRAIRRMTAAGFSIRIDEGYRLLVSPLSKLTEAQRGFIRSRKAELVALLADAETLAALLDQAGAAGIAWREGTQWDDGYLLAVGEVLYSSRRMVNRLGRRYAAALAPPMPAFHDAPEAPEIEPMAEETA